MSLQLVVCWSFVVLGCWVLVWSVLVIEPPQFRFGVAVGVREFLHDFVPPGFEFRILDHIRFSVCGAEDLQCLPV